MKKRTKVKLLFIVAFTVFVIHSCSKDDEKPENPTNNKTTAVFNSQLTYGSMTDQDGNTYKTITIGGQTWMAENLRTTKYRNGDSIVFVPESSKWKKLTTGAFCNFDNTFDIEIVATNGRLYNGYAVSDSRNIAPTGWHVPTIEEWQTLITFLGGDTVAGKVLKEADTTHWESSSKTPTNESGFTALPSGYRTLNGEFLSLNFYSQWWSSSAVDNSKAYMRSMHYFSNDIGFGNVSKNYGFSIRLVKDN